jgi:hypothetical protein
MQERGARTNAPKRRCANLLRPGIALTDAVAGSYVMQEKVAVWKEALEAERLDRTRTTKE